MMPPWLSVISPIFNGEAYLRQALDSIARQDCDGIECVAVNGESTDATLSILEDYQRRLPIRILTAPRDTNWVIKTNIALSQARGEYACFLHHDDLWFEGRLGVMRMLVEEHPEAALLLHPSNFLNARGESLGPWKCPLPAHPAVAWQALVFERLLVQNFISIVAPVFKRGTALDCGGLDESLWYTADWDFWLKLAATGSAVYYPTALSGFRIHAGSQTVAGSNYAEDFRAQHEVVAERHFASWPAPEAAKAKVRALTRFSIEMNVQLAASMHGQRVDARRLLAGLVRLSPLQVAEYLRDSRIWERTSARVRARLRATQP